MPPIRVMIVDDSVVVRTILADELGRVPEIEIAGSASNGRLALAKIPRLNPDLITLDIEMPVMDGLQTLAEIRKQYPRLPVIMFSTLTERGAAATLEALSLGATDYVTKPTATGSSTSAEAIRSELIPKIKALCGPPEAIATPAKPASKARWPGSQKIDIVAIGSSTGGPNALIDVIPHLPAGFPVPVVIVQHMPPLFTRYLAERLAKQSQLTVKEATAGAPLVSGHVWIAPGDFHMTVTPSALKLNQDAPENSCRPAVDVLFRSVASVFRGNVLAVVMTGMGYDGTAGAKQIRAAGGEVIIQDQASSVVWGMPGSVYAEGLADAVYPLPRLAGEITRRVMASNRQRAVHA